MNYVEQEYEIVKLSEIVDVFNFCREHRLEIFMWSDLQYEVHIDWEWSYWSWITFFGAMYWWIKEYNRQKQKILSQNKQ